MSKSSKLEFFCKPYNPFIELEWNLFNKKGLNKVKVSFIMIISLVYTKFKGHFS
ncbi:hypothetical protein BPJM79_20217 [Bacillus pumilus]